MPELFLPKPFDEPDFLSAALGDAAGALALRPVRLAGHALRVDPRATAVALVAEPGGEVAGCLVRADVGTAARLRFVMAAFGGGRATPVETSAGAAEAMVTAAGAPASATQPPGAEWRALLAEAAAEAMAHYGRRPAAGMRALMPGIGFRALGRARGRADTTPAVLRRGFAAGPDVETLAVARPYAHYFGVEEHRLRHRRFDGGMTGEIERAVFASGDAVTVLPFDPARRLVLLIEQFRPGPLARRDPHPWCLETVAGRCDPGESAEATARREAVEEAGVAIGRMRRVAAYYTSPGTTAEHITAFVGEAALDAAGGVHGLDVEDEDIRVLVVPLARAAELVEAGEINNAPLLVSLLWLDANADRLAAEWASGAAAG